MPLGNVEVQVRERTNEQENHKARWIDTRNMDGTGLELRSLRAEEDLESESVGVVIGLGWVWFWFGLCDKQSCEVG